MTYDAALHHVILFGGQDNNVYFNDTWQLNSASAPTPTPTPTRYTYAHSIRYSWAQSDSHASSQANPRPERVIDRGKSR